MPKINYNIPIREDQKISNPESPEKKVTII